MEALYSYLVKLSIGLSLVYIFYAVFLRRLTFYRWNRYYLATAPLIALVLPFVKTASYFPELPIPGWKESSATPGLSVAITGAGAESSVTGSAAFWTISNIILVIFITGASFMLIRFLVHYFSLIRLRRQAILIEKNPIAIYQVNSPIIPFSFGESIYLNASAHNNDELAEIIRHESVHVREKHSLDLVWAELLCVINWFNPFVWMIRFDIRQNLEFIADREAIIKGTDKKFYQYLLLKVTGHPVNPIGINFNFSSLKKRIAMINKLKSHGIHRLKFLLAIPVIAMIAFAFNGSNKPMHMPENFAKPETVSQKTGSPASVNDDDMQQLAKIIRQSELPVIFTKGKPMAINRAGGTATFSEGEMENKSDYKLLVFGQLMSAEEANKRYKKSNFTMVGAAPKGTVINIFGINENLLFLDTIQENAFVKPSSLLRGKTIK